MYKDGRLKYVEPILGSAKVMRADTNFTNL